MYEKKKNLLANSFEELLNYMRFEDITVQDICSNCRTSRTTFYRCFKDKYELMEWIYKLEADKLFMKFSFVSTKDFISSITNYIYSKKIYFSKIFKYSGQNSFTDYFIEYSIDICRKHFTAVLGENFPDEIMDSAKIYIAGCAYFYMQWSLGGFKGSPESISSVIYTSIPEPIKKYLIE